MYWKYLIGADRNALNVFLDGCGHNLVHRPVVTEMDDFGAQGLKNAAHDIDGSVVPVKQAGRRDKTDFMLRSIHRLWNIRAAGLAGGFDGGHGTALLI